MQSWIGLLLTVTDISTTCTWLHKWLLLAQVVNTAVTVNNSPIQNYVHPKDRTQPIYEMILGWNLAQLYFFSSTILICTFIPCIELATPLGGSDFLSLASNSWFLQACTISWYSFFTAKKNWHCMMLVF